MDWKDPGTIVAVTGAGATIGTLLLTKGVDALARLWGLRQQNQVYEDQQIEHGFTILIEELRSQLSQVRSELNTVRSELAAARSDHLECVRREERSQALYKHAAEHIERLEKEINSIREWRHNMANEDHAAVVKSLVDNTEETA